MKLLLPALVLTISSFAQSKSLAPLPASRHEFIIMAHRGDHVVAPENSLAALDSAIAHGVDYVEIDLRTSADGKFYIMHDDRIDRTTTGKGRVKELSSAVLDTCHLRNGENIPHFETWLQRAAGKMNLYLDFKDADVRKTMEVLRKFQFERSVLVYINAEEQYRDWKKYFPQVPVIVSLPDEARDVKAMEAFLAKYPAEVLDGDWDGYTPDMIRHAVSLGIRVWPDIQSPNEEKNWQKALELGFDGLQTDHPQQLAAWLKERQRRK